MKKIKIITEHGVVDGTVITKTKYEGVVAHWSSPTGPCSGPAKKIESLEPTEVWYRLDGVTGRSPAEDIDFEESCNARAYMNHNEIFRGQL
jgi:hypothetical protein